MIKGYLMQKRKLGGMICVNAAVARSSKNVAGGEHLSLSIRQLFYAYS